MSDTALIFAIAASAMLASALYLASGLRQPAGPRAACRVATGACMFGAVLLTLVVSLAARG